MTPSKVILYERTRWAVKLKQGLMIDETGAAWTGRTRDDARALIQRLSIPSAKPFRVVVTVTLKQKELL